MRMGNNYIWSKYVSTNEDQIEVERYVPRSA